VKRRTLQWLVLLAIILGLVGIALARPGGGESYSGGGGHSSGGGSGGGGGDGGGIVETIQLIIWIIELCVYHPYIALTLFVCIGAYVAYSAYKQKVNKDWDSGPPVTLQRSIDLGGLRRVDPDYSQIVFEDFVFRLFSTAHRARHSPEALAAIEPYVSAKARSKLAARDPSGVPVKQVIVGALRIVQASIPNRPEMADDATDVVRLSVELEANIMTAEKTYFSVETWQLVRDAKQRTKPPSTATTFPCPNCGAPWKSSDTVTQTCASCGKVVDNGRFDWEVENITLESLDERPPTLTHEAPERGTELDTYKAPNLDKAYAALKKTDPTVDQHGLNARIELVFKDLGESWSKNDLTNVRGLVSDGMYDYLDYWVAAYRQQGLRNLMRDTKITRTELAKVVSDRWYDAVTMRIWATGLDYVINEKTGQVVRGSKRKHRPYSEYWTLIRSSQRKGPAVTTRACGNCGPPPDVTLAGACTYCGAHATSG